MRKRERTREDLPLGRVSGMQGLEWVRWWTDLPVRPTMATFSPCLIDSEKSWTTGSPGLMNCQNTNDGSVVLDLLTDGRR